MSETAFLEESGRVSEFNDVLLRLSNVVESSAIEGLEVIPFASASCGRDSP